MSGFREPGFTDRQKAAQQAKQNLQKALGTLTTGFETGDLEILNLAQDIEKLAQDLVDAMQQRIARHRLQPKRENG